MAYPQHLSIYQTSHPNRQICYLCIAHNKQPGLFFRSLHAPAPTDDAPKVTVYKRTRRGKSSKVSELSLSIYYVNINGFSSKADSLKEILLSTSPDIFVLCELKKSNVSTLFKMCKKLNYEIISNKIGGLVIGVKSKLNLINVTSTTHNNIIVGLLHLSSIQIRIIASYGLQESAKCDERINYFEEVSIELEKCKLSGNSPLVIGDLNAKLDHVDGVICGTSPNGNLLCDIINFHDLHVLNFDPKCVGHWTRVQKKKNVTERSILDFIITDTTLQTALSEITIDEDRICSPFRLISKNGVENSQQFSDHNAIICKFRLNCSRSQANDPKPLGWKISETGLEKFNELSSSGDLVAFNTNNYTSFQNSLSQLMDFCFQPKRPPKKSSPEKKLSHPSFLSWFKIFKPYTIKGRVEKLVAYKYISFLQSVQIQKVQTTRASHIRMTINQLTIDNQFSRDKFWKLKKSIANVSEEKSSVVNDNGIEITTPSGIINEYKNEFINRLSHRTIHSSLSNYEKSSHQLLSMYLELASKSKSEPHFSTSEVTNAIRSFKPGAHGLDLFPPSVFLRAGQSLISSLTQMLNYIKINLEIPEQWLNVLITTIYKKKGSRKVLTYYRGIFITSVLSKIMEKLIKARIDPYTSRVSKLQAGSRANRSTCDNIFLLNGLIDHALYLNSPLYLTFYDFKTCFDSLWLEDSMITMWNLGVKNEMLALMYKLNEHSTVQVKTPHGITKPFSTPRIVKQGTVLGPMLCSSSTAEVVEFKTTGGASIGKVNIGALVFVDDITDINTNINDVCSSHSSIVQFGINKRLEFGVPKCVIMAINTKCHDSIPTLYIDGQPLKVVNEAKCLGDIFNNKGNNNSLISDRVKSADSIIINTFALCNDITLGLHCIETLMLLYKSVFLSATLFNCQAWSSLSATNIRDLQVTQLKFLKRLLKTPSSTPNACVFMELGVLPIVNEIHKRQLSFLHHILTLDKDDPVQLMYYEQKLLPSEINWANNLLVIRDQYSINYTDHEISSMSRLSWKHCIKTTIDDHVFKALSSECSMKSKTCQLTYNSFCTQQYLLKYPTDTACKNFRLRSKSVNCKINRQSSFQQDLSCRLCGSADESQDHMLICSATTQSCSEHLDMSLLYGEVPLEDTNILSIVNSVDKFTTKIAEH